ncbi:MAG: acyltransferase family protein [Roseobacter sp.]
MTNKTSGTLYRADIDGLRALAVVPIVLFHMGVGAISGGFVGVDVFFVISGYLITSLLLRDLEDGRFSFLAFYVKRIRRLGPALLVTLLLTLAVGRFVLAPEHLELLAESSLASLLSVSNILFWLEAGYFDAEAIYKPLLHTWSLGVEEQFYFIWPALLLLAWRLGRAGIQVILALLALASLLCAEYFLAAHPETVFFLAPFRIFEFSFGASLAVMTIWPEGSAKMRSGISVLGLALILGTMFLFDKSTRFPGLHALVPCLGAALIIWAGPEAWFNRILAQNLFVYIGRISYSLYLVHWPVVVYYTYLYELPQSPLEISLLTTGVVLLACAMYFGVEQPCRKRTFKTDPPKFAIGTRQLLFSVGGLAALIFGYSIVIDRQDGMKDRLPADLQALNRAVSDGRGARIKGIRTGQCHFSKMSLPEYLSAFDECLPDHRENMIVVLGDSHAADIWFAMDTYFPHRNVVQLTAAGCAFGRDMQRGSPCSDFIAHASAWIETNRGMIDSIIYSQRSANLMEGVPEESLSSLQLKPNAIGQVYRELIALADENTKVFYWGPRPEFHPRIQIALATTWSQDELIAKYHAMDMTAFADLDQFLDRTFNNSSVQYLSSYNVLCAPDCDFMTQDHQPIIVDYGHWSPAGGTEMLHRMMEKYPDLDTLGVPK